MFLHLTTIVRLLTEYLLKYSSHVLPLFQVKAMHSCTADDDIATRAADAHPAASTASHAYTVRVGSHVNEIGSVPSIPAARLGGLVGRLGN